MVYFMQPVEGGPIKIGTTRNVLNRRKNLQWATKKQHKILAVIDGGYRKEAEVHHRFEDLRIKGSETFKPEAALLSFIAALTPFDDPAMTNSPGSRWVTAFEASRVLGISRFTFSQKVVSAASITTNRSPGTKPRYLLADVERIARESVVPAQSA